MTPRVRTLWECSFEGHYAYKGHQIGVARDGKVGDWYIVVTAPNGVRAYDGWWAGSAGKSRREAVLEAIRGACINEPDEVKS